MAQDNELNVRIDSIGFGNLKLKQRTADFCYGIDAVLLADFAAKISGKKKTVNQRDRRIIDLGCGTGIIPLILSHKSNFGEIWGIELQEESLRLALENVSLNQLEERIQLVKGDVSDIGCGLMNEMKGSFDAVCANPPYMAGNRAITNGSQTKLIARHETSGTLADFIQAASYLVKPRGDFFMVHRPFRLVDILCGCRQNRLEPKTLRFVSPRSGEAPNILLIHCSKNGNPELKIMDPLWVYEGNHYSEEIQAIYERHKTNYGKDNKNM